MHYRDILKDQLKRRQDVNPKFSLRSFAMKLDLAPSKLSEVIAGKKKLSVERVLDLAERLSLKGMEKELFVVSAELESSKQADKATITKRLKELSQQLQTEKTTQRNAWYFGAIKALVENEVQPIGPHKKMGITDLQAENALRYQKRMKKDYPERDDITYEPTSISKKVGESLIEDPQRLAVDFAMLSEEDVATISTEIRRIIRKHKTAKQTKDPKNLRLVYFGILDVLKKGE